MNDLQLRSDDAVLTVSPASGGRIADLTVGELQVLGDGGHGLFEWGCYPMAPWAGRVRDGRLIWDGSTYQLPLAAPPHAMHGVTVDRPWQVIDQGIDTATSSPTATLRCDFDSRWPWRGHAVQSLTLSPGRLETVLEVHSHDGAMPAWSGWHPWFARTLGGVPARLDVAVGGLLRRDDDGIPTGEVVAVPPGPMDDCFVDVTWPVTVTWDGVLALTVTSDAPNVVVYDDVLTRPRGVCVEPQTAPPDAAALGLAATVEPGAPLRLAMTWAWERLG